MSVLAAYSPPPPPAADACEMIAALESLRTEVVAELYARPTKERRAELARRLLAIDLSIDGWVRFGR